MKAQALRAVFLSVALLSTLGAEDAFSQRRAPLGERGIWIADAAGKLRRVQPGSESFLRHEEPPSPRSLQLVLSVESFAHSASGALAAGELAVTRVRRAIASIGVATDGVTSEVAYVEPRYERRLLAATWEEPRPLGFDAAYVITVPTANPSKLGLLIDLAMGAGATRVLGVEPESSRPRR